MKTPNKNEYKFYLTLAKRLEELLFCLFENFRPKMPKKSPNVGKYLNGVTRHEEKIENNCI